MNADERCSGARIAAGSKWPSKSMIPKVNCRRKRSPIARADLGDWRNRKQVLFVARGPVTTRPERPEHCRSVAADANLARLPFNGRVVVENPGEFGYRP
jgi:hypothetical protein